MQLRFNNKNDKIFHNKYVKEFMDFTPSSAKGSTLGMYDSELKSKGTFTLQELDKFPKRFL